MPYVKEIDFKDTHRQCSVTGCDNYPSPAVHVRMNLDGRVDGYAVICPTCLREIIGHSPGSVESIEVPVENEPATPAEEVIDGPVNGTAQADAQV